MSNGITWGAWDCEWSEPVNGDDGPKTFEDEADAQEWCDKQNAGMDPEEADAFGFAPHKLTQEG
tara:strand:- start:163 stop:354 length:192 start_codon:yes stop_codon:yes gene_type:complete